MWRGFGVARLVYLCLGGHVHDNDHNGEDGVAAEDDE
jgi:hypothetical protein